MVKPRSTLTTVEQAYDWEMFVDDLGTNGTVTYCNLCKIDWWVRHAKVSLRNVGLGEDVSTERY